MLSEIMPVSFWEKKFRFNIDLTIVHKKNLLVCLFFQILDNLQLTLDISNSERGTKRVYYSTTKNEIAKVRDME